MLGNALHGAGSTPMFTLGTTFIDENTEAEKEYIVRMIFSSNLYTIFLDKKALCCFILY
jgi:hypothetical protein